MGQEGGRVLVRWGGVDQARTRRFAHAADGDPAFIDWDRDEPRAEGGENGFGGAVTGLLDPNYISRLQDCARQKTHCRAGTGCCDDLIRMGAHTARFSEMSG